MKLGDGMAEKTEVSEHKGAGAKEDSRESGKYQCCKDYRKLL